MNINSLTSSFIELKPERIKPDVRSMIKPEMISIREKIDKIEIVLTDKCLFDDDISGLNVECSSNVKGDVEKVEFDLIGIDPAICNTLRRIMIAEVPQMAFERILMYNNTSLIQVNFENLLPVQASFGPE